MFYDQIDSASLEMADSSDHENRDAEQDEEENEEIDAAASLKSRGEKRSLAVLTRSRVTKPPKTPSSLRLMLANLCYGGYRCQNPPKQTKTLRPLQL